MIPLKIQLKNFISYGADIQTIDFSLYPLICLSGKNGHGKSALLDAITWALWGQARKVSGNAKADQGLLRLGQTQMMVCLDFEFNGQIYRVRREFAVTYGKPYAALDFGIVNENEQFIPLTDKTISITQAKIEQTLNLSFDSFSNSAFLRQGQANEFSKKSPKERKEILANILGLNHYDSIRKLAMEKIRESTSEKANRQSLQTNMEQELQKKGELSAQLVEIQNKLQTNADQELKHALHKKEVEAAVQKHGLETQQCNMLLFQRDELAKQEVEQRKSMLTYWHEWRTIHKQMLTLPDIKKIEHDKKILIDQINEHQQKLQKSLELKEQYLKYKEQAQLLAQKINEQKNNGINQQKIVIERHRMELLNNEKALKDVQKKQQELSTEKKYADQTKNELDVKIKELTIITQKNAALEKQFERRKEFYQKFVEQGRWLTGELESLEQKKQLAITDEDPSCPLCEQNLSAARKRFLKSKFADTEHIIRHKLTRITKVVKSLKVILIDQHKEYEQSRKATEQCTIYKSKLDELTLSQTKVELHLKECHEQFESCLKLIQTNKETIEQEEKKLADLIKPDENDLAADNPYKIIVDQLAAIEEQGKKIKYDAQLHAQVIQQLKAIEQQLEQCSALLEQETLQTQRKKTVEELCVVLKAFKLQRAELDTKINAFAHLKEQAIKIAQHQANITKVAQEHTTIKETLLQDKARLETHLTTLQKLELEHKEQQKIIDTLNEAIFDYGAISSATGKDGIQALLIEDAIPEIEQEANYLLSRLTNNQSHVFIESLRDLKKGGSKETLDIKISDASGIRAYEMFSGGEAFRIDFALRIAISKLLARRAGTSLQTLIIDEGFGSQDEEGLSLIMDALYKIQEDFAKIIIVSHLPSMKDQFPVHFVIDKGPQGSTVSVIEQG
jgi:exonuclease SbcC